jgi:hypothetical protein
MPLGFCSISWGGGGKIPRGNEFLYHPSAFPGNQSTPINGKGSCLAISARTSSLPVSYPTKNMRLGLWQALAQNASKPSHMLKNFIHWVFGLKSSSPYLSDIEHDTFHKALMIKRGNWPLERGEHNPPQLMRLPS